MRVSVLSLVFTIMVSLFFPIVASQSALTISDLKDDECEKIATLFKQEMEAYISHIREDRAQQQAVITDMLLDYFIAKKVPYVPEPAEMNELLNCLYHKQQLLLDNLASFSGFSIKQKRFFFQETVSEGSFFEFELLDKQNVKVLYRLGDAFCPEAVEMCQELLIKRRLAAFVGTELLAVAGQNGIDFLL